MFTAVVVCQKQVLGGGMAVGKLEEIPRGRTWSMVGVQITTKRFSEQETVLSLPYSTAHPLGVRSANETVESQPRATLEVPAIMVFLFCT